jgi:hypothetical protein
MQHERTNTKRSDNRFGRVYASWPCGIGAETRVILTVRHGEPVVDIRFGELTGDRWRPSNRGVPVPLSHAEMLARALRTAITDAKRFGLVNAEYTPSRSGQPARR